MLASSGPSLSWFRFTIDLFRLGYNFGVLRTGYDNVNRGRGAKKGEHVFRHWMNHFLPDIHTYILYIVAATVFCKILYCQYPTL